MSIIPPESGPTLSARLANAEARISAPNDSLVTSTGGTTARALKDKFFLLPEDFGAAGDGATDDRAAFALAITTANGRPLHLRTGATYRIASALTPAVDVLLVGDQSTIRFDFVGIGLVVDGRRVEARGVTFDGNGKATGLVQSALSDSRFVDCAFVNAYSAIGSAKGLALVTPTTADVRGCRFSGIHALANGTEGDDSGAARGLFVSTSPSVQPRAVLIVGNRFTDIHSVSNATTDGFGNPSKPVMEDGDAVFVYSTVDFADAHVLVEGNSFENVGKRAAKFSANRCVARNNWIVSSWADASDPVNPDMMYAAIEAFGSMNEIVGNRILGSYYQHGIAVGNTAVTTFGSIIEGNEIAPTGTVFDVFSQTVKYGTRNAVFITRQHDVRVRGNRVSASVGFNSGVRITTLGQKITVADNVFVNNAFGTNVQGGSVTGMAITGNVIVGRGIGSVIGAYFSTGNDQVTVTGNTFDNVTDGVNFAAAPANVQIANNTYANVRGSMVVGARAEVYGAGTPEAAVALPVGSRFIRTDGGASSTLYVKESGTGNTGWAAK